MSVSLSLSVCLFSLSLSLSPAGPLICKSTRARSCSHIHTRVHANTLTNTLYMHTNMCSPSCVRARTHTHTCIRARAHTCAYARARAHTHTHTHTHTPGKSLCNNLDNWAALNWTARSCHRPYALDIFVSISFSLAARLWPTASAFRPLQRQADLRFHWQRQWRWCAFLTGVADRFLHAWCGHLVSTQP